MVTYNRELHASNIARMNAENDQADVDARLAAGLQQTIDRMAAERLAVNESIVNDTSWDEQVEHNRDLEYESRVADEQERTEGN